MIGETGTCLEGYGETLMINRKAVRGTESDNTPKIMILRK